ncbi:hypothetical protein [uncultured Neptuniibacter sp.]|uniref:hypothetical protein n=1 Tax=uncultured Neptuniibacter sp. TaxID=502143 RepID=UPI002609FA7B|nr:hypothetical protein [uncultured Neptuniibacter sp.]
MNFRYRTCVSKCDIVEKAKQILVFNGVKKQFPHLKGEVYESKIKLHAKGNWPGNGEFTGFVQEIDGKTYVVGDYNSPAKSTLTGMVIGVPLAFLFFSGNFDYAAGVIASFALIGYLNVKLDHIRITKFIRHIARPA